MTDIFKLPLTHPLFRTLSDGAGGTQPCLCMAYPAADVRAKRKALMQQLNEATDDDERAKLAEQILRLTDELQRSGRRSGPKRKAKISADPSEVKKARRSVAVALAATPTEDSTMAKQQQSVIEWDNKLPETIQAYLDDPKCEDWLRPQLETLLEKKMAASDEGDEGEAIAASHGGADAGYPQFVKDRYAAAK